MGKDFYIRKDKLNNAELVSMTLTKQLCPDEKEWLEKEGISEFDRVELDLDDGVVRLYVSFVDCNIKEEDVEDEER